jgi:molybdopterin-guanine dinucleotide biosynthesis protein A
LTGILLVGGASSRFGSPKALARLGDETLAERAWRLLGETCDDRVAIGKAGDDLELPFPVEGDGFEARAPIAGVVAGLRAASNEVAVVLPVDTPRVSTELLLQLADACDIADAAVPRTGPLPGAYSRRALPTLERALAAGELSLRAALSSVDHAVVDADPALLVNVNTPDDLRSLG